MDQDTTRLAAAIERLAAAIEADAAERRASRERVRELLEGLDEGPTRLADVEPIRGLARRF